MKGAGMKIRIWSAAAVAARSIYRTFLGIAINAFTVTKIYTSSRWRNRMRGYLPPVMVARPIDGITLNGGLEYLLDDAGSRRIFRNQPEAEAFLSGHGLSSEELEHIYFVEVPENEEERICF